MSDIAIRVQNLGKLYRIGQRERYYSLRDVLARTLNFPFRHLGAGLRSAASGFRSSTFGLESTSDAISSSNGQHPTPNTQNLAPPHIWALKEVSFEIKKGEVVGIIGPNGAGKTTLLKILSRITGPTAGCAEIYGRVGSLLEVGTGFHPELTGRENIYLNGAILGMKKREIERKFDEIISFAEIEKFLDTPVKRYSSGMYMRLAFAVAAHLEPEILLVDEVLAVGDAAFQKKCLTKMGDVANEGRTVLFVSHNMPAVQHLCDFAVWLNEGTIHESGPSSEIVANYLSAVKTGVLSIDQGAVQITKIVLRDSNGRPTTTLSQGDDIDVLIHYYAARKYERPYFWISIRGKHGSICAASMFIDGRRPEFIEGEGVIGCRFLAPPLLPQSYSLWMGIRDKHAGDKLFPSQEVAVFDVTGPLFTSGLAGDKALAFSQSFSLVLPYEWYYSDGTRVPVRATPIKK